MAFMLGYSRGLFDDVTGDLVGYKDRDGGEFLFARKATYGVFYSTADQVVTAGNAALVNFNVTAISSGISLSAGTKVVVSKAGLYVFQLSLHVHNAHSNFQFFDLWGRLNNEVIPNSRFKYSVPSSHGGQAGSLTPSQNFYLNLSAGDAIEMSWTTNDPDDVTLAKHDAETTPLVIPAAPSALMTVSEIARP